MFRMWGHRRVAVASVVDAALLSVLLTACSADERGSDGSEAGDGDGDGDGAGDGDGDGDGTGDGDGDGDGDGGGDGDGDGDGAPKFDFFIPDTSDEPVLPTIPETCAQALLTESTVGCVFHANKMQNFIEEPTSLVVGNVSDVNVATVQLYWDPGTGEEVVGGAVQVQPGESHVFVLSTPSEPGDVSVLRNGGAHRVESDIPMVAYQHSPISAEAHNDSSMLIPDHAQGQHYVAASWNTNIGNDYSYFNVVGIHDGTMVTWEPPAPTQGGTGVPAVAPGGEGEVSLDAYDVLQVTALTDVSGTLITTSEPAWVVAASPCVNIPANVTFCDHIEEQLLPLEYWGDEYVGAHAPNRGNEQYYWRVYSGDDGVTISTDPPQENTPVMLDRGEFVQFSTQESFMFSGDGPYMPVQYLEGQDGGAGTGDPASYQMVPTEQFLPRYVFVTGTGYTFNYVQVIRPAGGAEVFVDGEQVGAYYSVGAFEVSDWPVGEGSHLAESDEPFGVTQVGYTGVTSYAYPGGLRLATINPQPEG
jgi:hypothetical protein